jgi:Bacterial Ig domain
MTYSKVVKVAYVNAPHVSITSPENNSSLVLQKVIHVTIEAHYSGERIARVAFYVNGQLSGEDKDSNQNTYRFPWNGAPKGVYKLTATVTDSFGQTVTSSPTVITIR